METRTDTDPGPQPLWQRLKDRFVRFASEPSDSLEWKLRKSMGLAVILTVMVTYLLYGAFYSTVGASLAALLCWGGAVWTALMLLVYAKSRRYGVLSWLTLGVGQLIIVAIHLALGGFTSSAYVLIYTLTPLLVYHTVDDPGHGKYWIGSSTVAVLLATLAEAFIPHGNALSPAVLTALTAMNLLGFGAYVLLPGLIYGHRIRSIEQQMTAEREAHLAQTQAALERQTATAEILKVIASSPSDVQPVFDAIVHSAARLFGRKTALRTIEDDGLRRRARSYEAAVDEFHGPDVVPIDGHSISGRAVVESRAVQVADNRAPGSDIFFKSQTRELSFRSIASAPLMRDGVAIGVISMSSPQPGALTDQQMELLQTFADQAVIAIQNVRLFNETQEALQLQKASADVLGVISRSMGDASPVLDAILDKCEQLIDDATGSSISLIGEDGLVHVKHFRLSRLALAFDASPAEADKLLQRLRNPHHSRWPAPPSSGCSRQGVRWSIGTSPTIPVCPSACSRSRAWSAAAMA